MMKRKEYRERQSVLISFERDRYKDFIDLCDRERKSVSLKINEMLEEELEKNVIGEANPIRIRYEEKQQQNKFSQSTLDDWLSQIQQVAHDELALNTLAGQHKHAYLTANFYWKEAKKRKMFNK
jgi:seryl-tRNA synthetase